MTKRTRTRGGPTVSSIDKPHAELTAQVGRSVPGTPLVERTQGTRGGKPQVTVTNIGLALVRKMARDGASQNLIAARLGVNRTTFREAMERQPDVRLAWEHGVAEEEMMLVSNLRRAAAKGNVVASLFLLKTRHGYVEGAPPADNKPNITIVLPDAYSPEQYLKVINEARPRVTRPVLTAPAAQEPVR